MTVRELYQYLHERLPSSLSCGWDNDGLMCCPDGNHPVSRVLVALDVTASVADKAVREGYDVIISHHPMIFKGLKAVNEDSFVAAKTIRLLTAGVSVMSFHTRLDAVAGGVNDLLAALLKLEDVVPFGQNGETIGRIGTLEHDMILEDFARKVKALLGSPMVLYADAGRPVRRVAVLGGEGDDDVAAARDAGADTYLGGRLGYHNMTDAPEHGMNLVEAGHFYTENPVCHVLRELVLGADASIVCDCYLTSAIGAV